MAHLILAAALAFCQHLAYADIYSFCGLRPPNPGLLRSPQYPSIQPQATVAPQPSLVSLEARKLGEGEV